MTGAPNRHDTYLHVCCDRVSNSVDVKLLDALHVNSSSTTGAGSSVDTLYDIGHLAVCFSLVGYSSGCVDV